MSRAVATTTGLAGRCDGWQAQACRAQHSRTPPCMRRRWRWRRPSTGCAPTTPGKPSIRPCATCARASTSPLRLVCRLGGKPCTCQCAASSGLPALWPVRHANAATHCSGAQHAWATVPPMDNAHVVLWGCWHKLAGAACEGLV